MKLKKLKTKYLGRNVIYYKSIDSTQNEIFRLIKNKTITNGTLVIADIQTNGKGTHGRIWHTDEANNVAFSFYIQLDCNIKKIEGITVEIAKIIIDILEKSYGIHLEIKLPNDIVFNDKKIGGILTQSKIIGENVKYLVIGIGMNTSKMKFSEDIKEIATSIKKEFGIDVDINEFITDFCNEFERKLFEMANG